jgi:uncharacterized protein YjeT (DUF2065 family)
MKLNDETLRVIGLGLFNVGALLLIGIAVGQFIIWLT